MIHVHTTTSCLASMLHLPCGLWAGADCLRQAVVYAGPARPRPLRTRQLAHGQQRGLQALQRLQCGGRKHLARRRQQHLDCHIVCPQGGGNGGGIISGLAIFCRRTPGRWLGRGLIAAWPWILGECCMVGGGGVDVRAEGPWVWKGGERGEEHCSGGASPARRVAKLWTT